MNSRGRVWTQLAIYAVLVITAAVLQAAGEAYSGGFGSQPDESAHYVTGLLIRAYLLAGLPPDPLSFAEDFYLHYPRVAFGLWPPLFHAAAGVWMFLFGTERSSVLAFMALITAGWGFLLYRVVASAIGIKAGIGAALLLVVLPATQISTAAVMLDVAGAAVMFAAVMAYSSYLKTESYRSALLFGIWATAAILIKYNALSLALIPPIVVVFTGKYYLLRRKTFWLPAVVVACIAGPWYFAMRQWVKYAAEDVPRWTSFWQPGLMNLWGLVTLLGPLPLIVAAGCAIWIRAHSKTTIGEPAHPDPRHEAIVLSALVAAVWAFHSILYPIVETRYLLPAAPALIFLACIPIYRVANRSNSPALVAVAIAGLSLIPVFIWGDPLPRKQTGSYVQIAQIVTRNLPPRGVVLVSADPSGEGMLISELAMKDPRRELTVARASKAFADQNLMGQQYRLRVADQRAIMQFIDAVPVSVAVIEDCEVAACGEHVALLARTIETNPARWHLITRSRRENGRSIAVYRIAGNEMHGLRELTVDMRRTLGVVLGRSSEEMQSKTAD